MSKERHEDKLARWAKSGKAGSDPIQAATVLMLRDGSAGIETLMLKKASKIAFGGMWVFPGGRVDPEDHEGVTDGDELAAARNAAVREAVEESGLAITTDAMAPFSHWTPPPITPRRFLTWFFVAAAPEGEVVIDQGEIREHAWMSPTEAMERRDAGEIELAPPTFVSLHTLHDFGSVEEAIRLTHAREPERFATHIGVGDDGPIALWHGDAGWESSDIDVPGARHRLSMFAGRWVYDRHD
jgi:8-oxo-dGTP pyrophosphatase MutT (NUDIX family)